MTQRIRYLVIDVDGTMTDAGIYYDEHGNELKKFCTRDAAGFFAARKAGIQILVLTGRSCAATESRMRELKADYLFQNVRDKKAFLEDFIRKQNLQKTELGYIGDDLNDLAPMKLTGYVACPSDSCREILETANYISPLKGGQGVVRDVVEQILRERKEWTNIISEIYEIGV